MDRLQSNLEVETTEHLRSKASGSEAGTHDIMVILRTTAWPELDLARHLQRSHRKQRHRPGMPRSTTQTCGCLCSRDIQASRMTL